MTYFYTLTTTVAVILMIAALHAMLGGPWRRFPLLFLYLVLSLVASAAVGTAYFIAGAQYTDMTTVAYWGLHIAAQLSGLALVVTLTWQAAPDPARGARLVRWMVLAILLTILVSAVWNQPTRIRGIGTYSRWLMFLSRDIDFLAALMNLVLWTNLLANRRRERLLIMVSAGIGILNSGEAIGWALRSFGGQPLQELSNITFAVAGVATAYIWFRAMRLGAAVEAAKAAERTEIRL